MVVLALLMAGTSWAVAWWVSAWLVPPYLILMALLLSPPDARPEGEAAGAGSGPSDAQRPALAAGGVDDLEPVPDGPAWAGSPEGGSEQGPTTVPTKARRGKARAKKAKPIPGPAETTWVQVAPGKFVRVEASETSGQAGPHAPVGVPVEVPSTPQPRPSVEDNPLERPEGGETVEAPPGAGAVPRPEVSLEVDDLAGAPPGPLEDAEPAGFDPVAAGPGGDPTGVVESGSSIAREGDESAGSPGLFEGTPAADGNAPQAGGSLEEAEAGWPDAANGAVDDRAGAGPEVEGSEPGDAPAEGPEATGTTALADVPPEDADERGATLEGADPTETPVDETDLDDAGPLADVEPLEPGASRDADPPGTEALPVPPDGPTRRPGRLAAAARTLVGHPPRANDRGATPRRLPRSRRPARRPPDPARPARRRSGRPRQITRAFPPRSPPGGRIGRGRLSKI